MPPGAVASLPPQVDSDDDAETEWTEAGTAGVDSQCL
jgi:hypothetical protein